MNYYNILITFLDLECRVKMSTSHKQLFFFHFIFMIMLILFGLLPSEIE